MLTASTKTATGLPYKTTSAIMCQEVIKFAFAAIYWYNFDYKKQKNDGLQNFNIKEFLMYSVPGLTYALQNSIVYFAIAILGPPTFQVFSNLKIITTAVLFRFILPNRGLTIIQWLAVVLLFTAMVISKISVFSQSGEEAGAWASKQELIFGCGLLVVNSTLSAFSGVFNEWLIKKIDPEAPLQFKNMQLYFFGCVLNFFGNILQDAPGTDSGFFTGFSPVVWIIILNNAALGISVAYIMKYANNVVKCFTGAVAVYIATYLSSYFFGEVIDLAFMCGVVVLTVALYLYMGDHNKVLQQSAKPVQKSAPASIDLVEKGESKKETR
uniref:Sugar phosphate transporter domain-containing protein n=1 Tax=Lotharella globosa TaxID=91324 RepID=A0A7S4DUS5_9EUKA